MGRSAGSCATRRQMAQRRGSRVLALGGVLARTKRTCRVRFESRTSSACPYRLRSHQAEMVHSYSRMLKNSASGVLASFRPSMLKRSSSEGGSTEGAFPFAKTHSTGERSTRSAVCTSSGLHALRPHRRSHLLTGAALLRLYGDR